MHIKEYHSLTSKSLRKLKELRGDKSTACRKLENGFQEFEGSNLIISSKEEGRWAKANNKSRVKSPRRAQPFVYCKVEMPEFNSLPASQFVFPCLRSTFVAPICTVHNQFQPISCVHNQFQLSSCTRSTSRTFLNPLIFL